jgi:hypothetical protein
MRGSTIGCIAMFCVAGCLGAVSEPGGDRQPTPVEPPPDDVLELEPTTAIPRLSRREIEAAVSAVFGIEGAAIRNLPDDPGVAVNPATGAEDEVFDTFTITKDPGQVFVEGLESLAFEVARGFGEDTARVEAIAGCAPSGEWDPACLERLIANLGLALWRRPLSAAETSALLAAATSFGEEAGHYVAVRLVAQSLLQSPEFAYRSEVGRDAGDGFRRLDNYELVARLSFFLWGTAPSTELLQTAAGPELDDAALEALARTMAADPRADEQMRTFHRLWLRYENLLVSDAALATDMRAESDALLDRVLFGEGARWTTLFTSNETFVTPALATHYGLATVPASADWVPYGDDGRAGLLSHGSFLSLSSTRVTETLPSRRGAMLARRILCQTILPPPPDVDIDDGVEVPPDACKSEAYEAHRSSGSACAGCHQTIDPLGFGFERYDGLGRYREVEEANTSCAIDGAGSFGGTSFSGPREFATVIDESGDATRCGVMQLVRFAHRNPAASSDAALVERLAAAFGESGEDFRELSIAVVLDPAFRYRKEAP